jgi:hypothetical protein
MILEKMFDWRNICSRAKEFSFKQTDEDSGTS